MDVVEAVAFGFSSDAKREGKNCRTCCPKCGHHNLILSAGDRRPVIGHCKNLDCDVQREINAELKRIGLSRDHGNKRGAESDEEDRDTFRKAYLILRAARLADAAKPSAYLKGRGIRAVPETFMTLPAAESKRHTRRRFPAMVAPITDGEGLIGAALTWLTPDGAEKIEAEVPRKIYGAAKGGYVRLSEAKPDRPFVVAEGIETALSAMALAEVPGCAALSTSGLTSFVAPPCSKLIIAADNDESGAGLKAANELARRLRFEGKTVWIALPPEADTDWNDVLMSHGLEKAKTLWQRALEGADDDDESDGQISAPDEAAFMAITFPKRELMLAPWLPKPGLAMIHAARGDGKTWFALAVAKAVAAKEDFGPWRATNFGRVLYIDGELPGAFLQERLRKLKPSPPGTFNVLCRDAYNLRKQLMPDLAQDDGRDEIDRVVKDCNPDLIVLDSLSTLVRRGVENDAESWQPIQDWLLKHRWQGRTVLLVHHTGKSGQQRGTSKREDTLDTVIGLRKRIGGEDEDQGDSVIEATFTKARDFHGRDAEPLLLRLSMKDGTMTWTHEPMRSERDRRIQQLLKEGVKGKDIAKEMNLTPARVSQIINKMKRADNVIPGPGADRNKRDDRDQNPDA